MTPYEESGVSEAVKAFPKNVFREWLRFRRAAADQHVPGWRQMPRGRARIVVLDCSAKVNAIYN